MATELIGREEIVIHTILLFASRWPAGGTYTESEPELRMLLHQVIHDCALATPRRS